MKRTIIIQARMGSTRFPGKSLAPLCGKPVINHVIERCKAVPYASVIVAIPTGEADDPLFYHLRGARLAKISRGSPTDVLARYRAAAPTEGLIARVTADCPLVDHRVLTRLFELVEMGSRDYAGQCNDPDGSDAEVFTLQALIRADAEATDQADREHVTPWMRENLRCLRIASGQSTHGVKFSVDTVEDLERCRLLIGACGIAAPWEDYAGNARRLCRHDDVAAARA